MIRTVSSSVAMFLAALVAVSVGALVAPGPVAAESPIALTEDLAVDGVYVAPGRIDIDETSLVMAVEDVRFGGLRVVVVAPNDPQPTAKAFARRIQEATSADVAIVFPRDEPLQAFVIDDLSSAKIRSINTARLETDPAQAVRAFAQEVIAERDQSRPALIGRLIRIALFLAAMLVAVAVLEAVISRTLRSSD